MNKNEDFKKVAESFYKALNEFISDGTLSLLDIAYPEHDGNADADVVASMMELRDRLYAIKNGCEIGIRNLTDVVEPDDEPECQTR